VTGVQILVKNVNVEGTKIPVQTWTGPEVSRRLRLRLFLDSPHMEMTRLSTLPTDRL